MKRRLVKSNNKKVFGVVAGLAEYFDMDVTPIRVLFVVWALVGAFPFLIVIYLGLAYFMPKPEPPDNEGTD